MRCLEKKKERKFSFWTKSTVLLFLSLVKGRLYNFLLANLPLNFASHYEDVAKFSWGDVMEWISLWINIYTYDLIFIYFI